MKAAGEMSTIPGGFATPMSPAMVPLLPTALPTVGSTLPSAALAHVSTYASAAPRAPLLRSALWMPSSGRGPTSFWSAAAPSSPSTGQAARAGGPTPPAGGGDGIDASHPLVSAYRRFGLDLFRELIGDRDSRRTSLTNVFCSPVGVATVLTMLLEGADGDTWDEIYGALSFSAGRNLGAKSINEGAAALWTALLSRDPQVALHTANGVLVHPRFVVSGRYADAVKGYFDGTTGVLHADSMVQLNRWVSLRTNGMIDRITDPIPPETAMVLLNAVYFKGLWTNPFDRDETEEKDFTRGNGELVKVPMMKREGNYRYMAGRAYEAIRLPYGEGQLSMVVLLPTARQRMVQFAEMLNDGAWMDLVHALSTVPLETGMIELPRFRAQHEMRLNEPLSAMGMPLAFNEERADFSRIAANGQELFLSRMQHHAVVDVDEAGTRAAGVTRGSLTPLKDLRYRGSFHMVVDRPFVFVIQDDATGIPLFMGAIDNPMTGGI